jgi:hypothetical protein
MVATDALRAEQVREREAHFFDVEAGRLDVESLPPREYAPFDSRFENAIIEATGVVCGTRLVLHADRRPQAGGRRYIRSGALTPSMPSVAAITRLVATHRPSRAGSKPSPAPTTWQSR